jgi:hypothetical protein
MFLGNHWTKLTDVVKLAALSKKLLAKRKKVI